MKLIVIFLCSPLKDHNLGFLGLIFNIHDSQLDDNMLRQFCKPARDRDSMIKSSAYKSDFNLVPFGKIKGSDNVF